jgi:hypothetical protein
VVAAKKKKAGAPKKSRVAKPATEAPSTPVADPEPMRRKPPITPVRDAHIGLFNDDRIERDIEPFIHKYFAQTEDGDFVYHLDDLRNIHGITDDDFDNIFEYMNCGYATDASGEPYHCRLCGEQVYFSTREDYDTFCKTLSSRGATCEKCVAREDLKASMTPKKWKEYLIREQYEIPDYRREFKPKKKVSFVKLLLSLKAICMKGLSEDLSHIRPVSEYASELVPGAYGIYDLLRYIHGQKGLFVHPGTHVDAVTIEGDKVDSFFLAKVFYMLPMIDGSTRTMYDVINFDEKCQFNADDAARGHYSEFWKELSLASAITYLEKRLEEFSLPYSCGEKTIAVIHDALTTFSVSQVYNFIWRSTRDAAAFYMKGGVTKSHAANTVVGNIARQAERARAERWDVKKYGQDWTIGNPLICELLSLDLFGDATAWFDASLADVIAAEARLAAWQPVVDTPEVESGEVASHETETVGS